AGRGPPSGGRPKPGCAARAASVGRAAEALLAALAPRQLADLSRLGERHRDDDELRDSHPRLDDEPLGAIRVEQDHPQLAAVTGVDEAGRVQDGDTVARGESRAWLDETGMTIRDCDGEAGADHGALPRSELYALARGEIEQIGRASCRERGGRLWR